MESRDKKVIISAIREDINIGNLVYWDCTDLAGLEYEPDVLIHDSDGCEYSQKTINVATGIVLEKITVLEDTHKWSYDVLCSDNIIRRISDYSLWIVQK